MMENLESTPWLRLPMTVPLMGSGDASFISLAYVISIASPTLNCGNLGRMASSLSCVRSQDSALTSAITDDAL